MATKRVFHAAYRKRIVDSSIIAGAECQNFSRAGCLERKVFPRAPIHPQLVKASANGRGASCMLLFAIHAHTGPCRCRSASDVWCVERPDGRWNINTLAGTKTSRKTQADAEAYCSAVRLDPSLLSKKKATGNAPPPRTSRHPVYVPPAAAKPRAAYGSLVVPPMKKAADSFVAVIDHLAKNPHKMRSVLGVLVLEAAHTGTALLKENQRLQVAFDEAKSLMLGGSYDPSGLVNSKAIEAVLGCGYAATQERSFRRHRHSLQSKLRELCGDDTLRQQQLLQGCLSSFRPERKTANPAEQVLAGIQATLQKIKAIGGGKGRTTHTLRVAQQTLQAAGASQVDHVHSAAISALLGTSNRQQLVVARDCGLAFLNDDAELPYDLSETVCNEMDPAWAQKVRDLWEFGTRASENKGDELKNPKDRSDPRLYRVRFLERTLGQMVVWMNEVGKADIGPDFSVSSWYVAALKPFYVRRPGRQAPPITLFLFISLGCTSHNFISLDLS